MISRRSFLGFSAAALTVGLPLAKPTSAMAASRSAAVTPATFTLSLVNKSGSGVANAYVAGTSPDQRPVFIRADGSSFSPSSPSAPLAPLPADCAIPFGSGAQVNVPRMSGARLYVVLDATLDFFVNPGPTVVHPDFLNPSDPNYTKNWSFVEFTFNDVQLYGNISYVDFVGVPTGLALTTASSGTQTVPGLPSASLDPICGALSAQGSNWAGLVQTASGRNLRAISPHHRADRFAGYLDDYINQVWQHYASQTLTIDSQNPSLGTFTGRVTADGLLTFANGETFAKPTTADVWSCDSGPFAISPGASDARKSIIPRLAAALNRTTLLTNPNQPTGEDPDTFYRSPTTNHYARIVHSRLLDGRGYAFPYDDVTPGPDFSGAVHAGDPSVLTVTVGSPH